MVVFHMFDSHHCASVTKYYTVSFEMAVLTKKETESHQSLMSYMKLFKRNYLKYLSVKSFHMYD